MIETTMADPDSDAHAWDPDQYRYGNSFRAGFANPVKPAVQYNKGLEEPSTVSQEVSDADDTDDGESDTDGPHIQMISSKRYQDYMRQDAISQLLTPSAKWRLIAYAVMGLGALMLINLLISLVGAGVL